MWNNNWKTELDDGCYTRLCECRNTKNDIVTMAMLMAKHNSDKTAEDCLVRMLEWVCDWNNQWEIDMTAEEYDEALLKIEKELGIK